MAVKFSFGSSCLIKPELDLIEAICRISSELEGKWTVNRSGACDLLAVSDEQTLESDCKLKEHGEVVRVLRRGAPAGGPVIYRPIRADEVIKLLSEYGQNQDVGRGESAQATRDAGATHKRYRLKRWPPQSLLSQNPSYPKLAAYLSRRAITLTEFKALAVKDEAKCWGFLMKLEALDLVAIETAEQSPPAESRQPGKRGGLFALLRKRLGL